MPLPCSLIQARPKPSIPCGDLSTALGKIWKRQRFDYLVDNAGFGCNKSMEEETTEEEFDGLVDVHLKGVFFLTQKLLPMIEDGGRIVNVSTGLTRFCFPGRAAYAMMKGGVEVFTRYLANELGPRKITANVVAPWRRCASIKPGGAAHGCERHSARPHGRSR